MPISVQSCERPFVPHLLGLELIDSRGATTQIAVNSGILITQVLGLLWSKPRPQHQNE